MTEDHTERQVVGIVQRLTGHLGAVQVDQPLHELGVDSVIAVEMILQAEEVFEIEIDDEHLRQENLVDVSTFTALIRQLLAK